MEPIKYWQYGSNLSLIEKEQSFWNFYCKRCDFWNLCLPFCRTKLFCNHYEKRAVPVSFLLISWLYHNCRKRKKYPFLTVSFWCNFSSSLFETFWSTAAEKKDKYPYNISKTLQNLWVPEIFFENPWVPRKKQD